MRKKFVKVMFFGALAFTMTTAVTSCQDYDDDVKNLQSQIDNITSTSPVSTEAMSNAIASAKQELQGEVDRVEGLLADKAAQSKLESEIQRLEGLIVEDAVDQNELTQQLADLKNDLQTLINAKADDSYVKNLEQRVADLESAEATLAKLIEAEKKFQENGDLSGYYDSAFDKLINKRIVDALATDGKIASYVSSAVSTGLTNQLTTINNKVAAQTGNAVASLEEFVGKVYNELYAENTGVLARLNELETYSQAIDAFIKANNAQYEDYADVLAQIEETRQALAAITIPDGGDLTDAIKEVVDAVLKETDGTLANLQKSLNEELAALKGMIQSIVYIPSTLDRSVDFYTLYAKKSATDTKYEVAARSEATQELNFRISPASAVTSLEDFNNKYTISLNAELRPNWKRDASSPFDVKATKYENGILTVSMTTNDTQSYAVALNLTSKVADADKDKGLATTDINSDYLAVVQSNYYLQEAYYKVATAADKKIIFDNAQPVDLTGAGVLTVGYTTTASGTTVEHKTFSELNVANIFSTEYSLTGTDKNLFDISQDGKVSLKAENQGIVAMIGKSVNVTAKVNSDYYFTQPSGQSNPATLGKVTVARLTKEMSHAYAAETKTWIPSTAQDITIDLNEAEVYQDLNVNISVSEYQALEPEGQVTDPTKVRMVTGANNDLSVVIPAGTKAGDYETKVVLKKDDEYTVTITKKITVEYPDVPELKFDPVLYNGTVNLSLTPTPDSEKPSGITTVYDLTEVLAGYDELKTAVEAVSGEVVISVPNKDKFNGLTYSNNTLTFDKTAFGKKDGTPADEVVKMKVEVKFDTETVQSIEAPIAIAKISGSWVAGPKAVSLTDKTATVNLAKGFAWKDHRGYEMWKDGEAVTGGDHFAANTSGLSVYGLNAPTFTIVNEKGEPVTEDKYLKVENGKVSFTETGKKYSFANDYSIRVKVSATSQWGAISGYSESDNIITVTVKKEI